MLWFRYLNHACLQAVLHDGLVYDAAAVQALPPVEGYEVVGKPLRDHQATAFRTFHTGAPFPCLCLWIYLVLLQILKDAYIDSKDCARSS